MVNVFVAFPFVPEPIPGYRDVFRSLERHYPFVNFVFADETISSDVVLEKIRQQINTCNLCLCDITGWNANVCLELGLAMGMEKRVQLLFRRGKSRGLFRKKEISILDLPADIRGHGRIEYADGSELHAALRTLIQQEVKDSGPDFATQAFRSLCEAILGVIGRERGLKKTEIAARLYLETGNITSALEELLRDRRIDRVGKYMNALYYVAGSAPAQKLGEPLSDASEQPEDHPPTRA